MEPALRHFDARDYLRIFTKRKWHVILVALAATIIGGLVTVSADRSFRATAVVLIHRQGEPVIWVGDRSSSTPQRQDLALDTQAQIASSTDCAELAAQALANAPNGRSSHVTSQDIASSINATPSEPDLLRIEAKSKEESQAIEFANAVATAFVNKNQKLRQAEATAAREFLEEALRRSQATLDIAQNQAATYQEQIGIVSPEAEPRLAIEQLSSYRSDLEKAKADLQEAQADQVTLAAQLARTPAYRTEQHDVPNPARTAMLQQLQTDQVALAELRARYTDNWPAVRELKSRIDTLHEELARQPETVRSTSVNADEGVAALRQQLLAAERRVTDGQARIAALTSTVQALQANKQQLPAQLAKLNRLLDRVQLAKTSYQNVLTQLENARLNEAMKQSDAEIINHAVSAIDVSPRVGRNLLAALALGLVCGIALALALEALDDTLHSPEDVAAYTEANFLGMVPMLEDTSEGLVTVFSPKSPPSEAYRTLRSNIHFAQVDHPARTFLLTSAGASEGKTLTTANLATVFAQAGQEVLLIDTDMRRPSLHRAFGMTSERGLTNVLVGEATLEDVIQDTMIPGLRIVPTGPLPPNPAELLESEQMTRVVEHAKTLADVVFFDTPPTIVLTDAVIMAAKVDRVILVAEAGQVTRDAFNEMFRLLTNARGNILGVILNKVRLNAGDYYYYYYYYDYSHYSSRRGRSSGTPSLSQPPASAEEFTDADAPSMLEELFGADEDQLRLEQQPADLEEPVIYDQEAVGAEQPSHAAHQPPPAAPPTVQETKDQDASRSPLDDLFNKQNGNDT